MGRLNWKRKIWMNEQYIIIVIITIIVIIISNRKLTLWLIRNFIICMASEYVHILCSLVTYIQNWRQKCLLGCDFELSGKCSDISWVVWSISAYILDFVMSYRRSHHHENFRYYYMWKEILLWFCQWPRRVGCYWQHASWSYLL